MSRQISGLSYGGRSLASYYYRYSSDYHRPAPAPIFPLFFLTGRNKREWFGDYCEYARYLAQNALRNLTPARRRVLLDP